MQLHRSLFNAEILYCIADNLAEDLLNPHVRDFIRDLHSGKYGVDLSLKPEDDIPQASFRKLNVSWTKVKDCVFEKRLFFFKHALNMRLYFLAGQDWCTSFETTSPRTNNLQQILLEQAIVSSSEQHVSEYIFGNLDINYCCQLYTYMLILVLLV